MEQAMRDEFEANAKVRWSTDYDDFGDGLFSIQADGRYEYEHIQWDWETWQASRAALRVELPPTITAEEVVEHFNIDEEGIDMAAGIAHMVNGAIWSCAAFIKQAGIEVK
ncbi:hypothetical protein QK355_07665 [Pseudomonas aeruginosa]|uniref:hypothetical protein n=1 Tax=Pseudomonas aeruginosa TaxID=287 RepID=UPI0024A88E42|nr:hypothetical protein [Pseudomonas aeruginosa]